MGESGEHKKANHTAYIAASYIKVQTLCTAFDPRRLAWCTTAVRVVRPHAPTPHVPQTFRTGLTSSRAVERVGRGGAGVGRRRITSTWSPPARAPCPFYGP